jgi:hypothetical protein
VVRTVTVVEPELGPLLTSPLYEAVTMGVPVRGSVYVTEQEPAERVHALEEKYPDELLELKETVPDGEVPLTVALQVVGEPPFTEPGVHETEVEVCLRYVALWVWDDVSARL